MTINELLCLIKAVRDRLSSLKGIRGQVTTSTVSFYGDTQRKEVTPQYDVKAVDKKIVELETWLFKADAAIKQANAITKVDIDADVEKLLASVE